MARPIWSGVITFGLVTVPVQLFTATESHTVHFQQVQRGTSDRVRNRRVNERTGEDVDYGEVVKGYPLGDSEYVIVEPEELDAIAPGKSQVIDVSGFVGLDEVEPVYFARAYYLSPKGEQYTKPYELLRSALAESGRIGVATFVMRTKQYLVALRPQEDVLLLQTLHWADEVRDPRAELPTLPEHTEAGEKELRTAQQLIEAMTVRWNPEDYADTYQAQVRELVEAKRTGEEIVTAPEPPRATNVVDMTDALERSVRQARKGRGGDTADSREEPAAAGRSGGQKESARGKRQRQGAEGKRPEPQRAKPHRAAPKRGAGKRGAPKRAELSELSKDELYQRATDLGVQGRSKMNRDQLIDALTGSRRTAEAA